MRHRVQLDLTALPDDQDRRIADVIGPDRQPVDLHGSKGGRGADAQLESTSGQEVEAGELLRQHGWMPVVVGEYEGGEAQRRCRAGDRGQADQRADLAVEMIGKDDARVPQLLGPPGHPNDSFGASSWTYLG